LMFQVAIVTVIPPPPRSPAEPGKVPERRKSARGPNRG